MLTQLFRSWGYPGNRKCHVDLVVRLRTFFYFGKIEAFSIVTLTLVILLVHPGTIWQISMLTLHFLFLLEQNFQHPFPVPERHFQMLP